MTPPEQVFDRSVFVPGRTITLFRLANEKYANLSGIGATIRYGRWNRAGQQAIYTSLDVSTAVSEILAHTPKDRIPTNYVLMRISLKLPLSVETTTKKRAMSLTGEGLGSSTSDFVPMRIFESLASAEHAFNFPDAWKNPFAIAVPSVRVPAWNVVLYPQEKGFWEHIALENIEAFDYDPQYFPVGSRW